MLDWHLQGIAISNDSNALYVHNFMERSVTVLDVSNLVNGLSETVSVVTTISAVANESLSPDVLRGKQLFYDAGDPRLALESYMSCASCHNEGTFDGRTWDFKQFGEGLRNTISLVGHAGTGQGPLHWTANFDEVQDFENQIRDFTFGLGLMSNADFAATMPPLGAPKAGLSEDLDALAAYVASLSSFGISPFRATDGALTNDGQLGKAVFEAANCASCHTGVGFTDSAYGEMHNIGTIKPSSGERMGALLSALDTPTLKGLWSTGPYLHDGSAASVRAAVEAHDPALLGPTALTATELNQLAAYLLQIDDLEAANTVPQLNHIGNKSMGEGETLTIAVNASDAEPGTLTLSLSDAPPFVNFVDNGNGTASISATPGFGDAGMYAITASVTDNGPGSLSDEETFNLTVVDAQDSLVFEQDAGGLLVMEAEHYTDLQGGGGIGNWAVITQAGASNSEAVKAAGGGVTEVPNSPWTEYGTNFVVSGGHYVWIRFRSFNAGSDSVSLRIDTLSAQKLTLRPVSGNWEWIRFAAPYSLTQGEHVLRLYRREKEVEIDKIVVTPDSGYAPSALGPPESTQSGGVPTNLAPVLTRIGPQQLVAGSSLTIQLNASDPDGDQLVLSATGVPTAFAAFTDNGNGTGSIVIAPSATTSAHTRLKSL